VPFININLRFLYGIKNRNGLLRNIQRVVDHAAFNNIIHRFATGGAKQQTMAQVKNGDTVKVHYTGKLTSGEQFDSSAGREPLEFTVGGGQMIKGFDAAMPGMSVGDKKTINIPAADGYGEKDPSAVIEFPKENVPAEMKLEIGMQLTLSDPNGNPFPVVVTEMREDVVVLDANHFLAGEELVFDIELVEING
jgi:peptidylprolyl isomerase